MDEKALYDITYGLYVVTVNSDNKLNGQIVNTVFQVTANPKTLTVCIHKDNYTHELINESKRFGVCILTKDAPMPFIGLFGFKSGRNVDKFKDLNYIKAPGGSPIITDYCMGYLECDVKQTVDVGTHTMFIGEVIDAEVLKEGEPLTYAYYHGVKKGLAPKNAPTYREKTKKPEKETLIKEKGRSYQCPVCGYIYDPGTGDGENGVKPGTLFVDLPEDWTCPLCRAPKSSFVPLEN